MENEMVVCISDIHFGIGTKESGRFREKLFVELLQKLENSEAILYIVGDLFDYWFEYNTVIPNEFYQVLAALKKARENGVEIHYIIGNHDFGHQNFFEKELQIPLYWNDLEKIHFGQRFIFSHGDGKAFNDKGYLFLKKILRNKVLKKLYQFIHPDIGIWLAKKSSQTSRTYTDTKDYSTQQSFEEKNGLEDFAKNQIDSGITYVIMGHIHKIVVKNYGEGIYYNLGEWFSEPHCAVFTENSNELIPVTALLTKLHNSNIPSSKGEPFYG